MDSDRQPPPTMGNIIVTVTSNSNGNSNGISNSIGIEKQPQQVLVSLYGKNGYKEYKDQQSLSSSQKNRNLPPEELFRLMKEELDKIGFMYQGKVKDVYSWLAHLVDTDGHDPVEIIETAQAMITMDRDSDQEHKIRNHPAYLMTMLSD